MSCTGRTLCCNYCKDLNEPFWASAAGWMLCAVGLVLSVVGVIAKLGPAAAGINDQLTTLQSVGIAIFCWAVLMLGGVAAFKRIVFDTVSLHV